ncbi:hypothetical protein A3I25_00905 [Candidatus Nomurabacteria bacterium RIFCSPLOWO2_02_FULL_42_17]|uniref:Dephospho-CoA kinase n=1 Tax=Candidatus Nomurabacteria bacterium RIFCSPLOWO2_02_FULL_42_17 TaxID=1801789 RepID=A0A1F6XPR3_9BACT|nr:MAG: hypothetical protein UV08_C0037G0006 [Parcubacteria group bacterium GW2011_GWA2_42_18]OGI96160.1 MAG: hypothetical protein A3I25_00905 [Candidatus Nomurabacteria bacterium RIFCSPLOWO2_02_FULL_42_17]
MKTIIGIIGTVGSGKDTVAEYISNKLTISTFQISQPLKDIAKERGIKPTRENLIKIGSDLVKENGAGFLVKLLVDKIPEDLIIITGIRVTEVIDYIRKNYNLILLAITAEPKIRFKRCILRNKLGEAKTLTEFIENEQKENSPPNTQRLFECLNLANYSISNNDDLKILFQKVDEFLRLKKLSTLLN